MIRKISKLSLFSIIACFTLIYSLSIYNFEKKTTLKFLIWNIPDLSLGLLTSISFTSGAIFTSGSIILLSSNGIALRRKVIINPNKVPNSDDVDKSDLENSYEYSSDQELHEYPPERGPKEPPPTLSVPYRIVRMNDRKSQSSRFNEKRRNKYSDVNLSEEKRTEESFSNNTKSEDWNSNSEDW